MDLIEFKIIYCVFVVNVEVFMRPLRDFTVLAKHGMILIHTFGSGSWRQNNYGSEQIRIMHTGIDIDVVSTDSEIEGLSQTPANKIKLNLRKKNEKVYINLNAKVFERDLLKKG